MRCAAKRCLAGAPCRHSRIAAACTLSMYALCGCIPVFSSTRQHCSHLLALHDYVHAFVRVCCAVCCVLRWLLCALPASLCVLLRPLVLINHSSSRRIHTSMVSPAGTWPFLVYGPRSCKQRVPSVVAPPLPFFGNPKPSGCMPGYPRLSMCAMFQLHVCTQWSCGACPFHISIFTRFTSTALQPIGLRLHNLLLCVAKPISCCTRLQPHSFKALSKALRSSGVTPHAPSYHRQTRVKLAVVSSGFVLRSMAVHAGAVVSCAADTPLCMSCRTQYTLLVH